MQLKLETECVQDVKNHIRPPSGMSKMKRRLSMIKSTKSALMRSQTGNFDHNRWLFETKATYGYGDAIWPKEDDDVSDPAELMSRPWRPLTRKLKIPTAILSPYRITMTFTVWWSNKLRLIP